MPTPIEWVRNPDGTQGETLNPFRARDPLTGRIGHMCSKISPGCRGCYASKLQTNGFFKFHGHEFVRESREHVELFIDEKALTAPLRKRKPTTWFPFDMTDLFWEEYPDEWIDRWFAVMALSQQHRYLVLTKRAARLREWFLKRPRLFAEYGLQRSMPGYVCRKLLGDLYGTGLQNRNWVDGKWPLPNVMLGVSVESRQYRERIDYLRETPAAGRFLSLEPLLEDLGTLNLKGIDWVIVGGESGPGARPMHSDWVRSIRDRCQAAGVPFFFKQWGEYGSPYYRSGYAPVSSPEPKTAYPWGDKLYSPRLGKKAAGALLDGREWRELPAMLRSDR